jgi:hypothetical protein
MDTITITRRITSLYVAYAPESGAYSFGGCFEEAVNGLHEELAARAESVIQTGEGRKNDAWC